MSINIIDCHCEIFNDTGYKNPQKFISSNVDNLFGMPPLDPPDKY